MKFTSTLLATFFAIIIFSSCQKDTDFSGVPKDSTITTPAARVNTYTEDVTTPGSAHSVTTYNLSYDASGRLTNIVSASNAGDKYVYQYSTNSFVMEIFNSNKLSLHENFFLNNIGFVDSTVQYDDANDTTTEKYLYNSTKQLVKLKEYDYFLGQASLFNTIDYTYDANGNVTAETESSGTTTYEYYSNYLNTLFVGQPYFYANKNLVKTTTYKYSGVTQTFDHTYTFDGNNRITSEKMVGSDGSIILQTYTY